MNNLFDIAIIGFGATGVSLLKQIQEQAYARNLDKISVLVCDKDINFARGSAFNTVENTPILNTLPDLMSITSNDPSTFVSWLDRKSEIILDYPSRSKFSDFIQDSYISIKKSNILDITEIKSETISVSKFNENYSINFKEISKLTKSVVFCIGVPKQDIPNFSDRAIVNFQDALKIPDNSRVIIAGTSLTAVDYIRILNKKSPEKIVAYSRSGFPPTCISRGQKYTPKYLNFDNLIGSSGESKLDIFLKIVEQERDELLERKIDEKIPSSIILEEDGFSKYASYLINRAQCSFLPYQDSLFSTRYYMNKVWRSFSLEDKVGFNTKFKSSWARWRHPLPIKVMDELKEGSEKDTIEFRKGTNVNYENGKFYLDDQFEADYLIDATGSNTDYLNTLNPLLKSIIDNNFTEKHPAGGIKIDPVTFNLMHGSRVTEGLYSIGPINSGCLFNTNAFWFNSKCAYSLSTNLIGYILERG